MLTSCNAPTYIGAGRVHAFDAAIFPNKKNVIAQLANPTWDMGRMKSIR